MSEEKSLFGIDYGTVINIAMATLRPGTQPEIAKVAVMYLPSVLATCSKYLRNELTADEFVREVLAIVAPCEEQFGPLTPKQFLFLADGARKFADKFSQAAVVLDAVAKEREAARLH